MYNKVFTKILDSSVWLEPASTRLVWFTLIAAMDQDGFCAFAAVGNLANRARVSIKATQAAIACLEGPDAQSTDPEYDGRRIERVPGGWMVLNAHKYAELATREHVRRQTRDRVTKHRETKRSSNGAVTGSNDLLTRSDSDVDSDPDTHSKSKTQTLTRTERTPVSAKAPTTALLTHFDNLHRKKLGERAAIDGGKDAKLLAALWKTHGTLVAELMVLFFQQNGDFVRGAGYTVGVFKSQFGKLITLRAERKGNLPARETEGRPTSRTGGTVQAGREYLTEKLAEIEAEEGDSDALRER